MAGKAANYAEMTAGELADAHRGHGFAKRRADDALAAIEAELDRRGLTGAKGRTALAGKSDALPLVDLKRLRAEQPEICRRYAKEGSLWTSRTLHADEHGT